MAHLIDTHAHLEQIENLDQALASAREAGVSGIIAVSVDLESSEKNLAIKQKTKNPAVYLAMGMHPSEANLAVLPELIAFIRAHEKDIVAIGEIGLDFWYQGVKKDSQKKVEQLEILRAQCFLAKEFNLPVIIHSRGAWQECLQVIKEIGIEKAVFHWYSGPKEILSQILDCGYYMSATPSIAYSPQARDAAGYAPRERILIETDCPVYFKNRETGSGFQAQPKDVFRTLDLYCAMKQCDKVETALVFNKNAKQLFGLTVQNTN